MLKVREVSKKLGVHPQTVYRRIRQGKLRVARIGRTIRISEEEIKRLGG